MFLPLTQHAVRAWLLNTAPSWQKPTSAATAWLFSRVHSNWLGCSCLACTEPGGAVPQTGHTRLELSERRNPITAWSVTQVVACGPPFTPSDSNHWQSDQDTKPT